MLSRHGRPVPAALATELTAPDRFDSGMMFVCTKETYKECMELRLLGLPHEYLNVVKSLKEGRSALFLFNMTDRRLHGIFEAAGDGSENIDPQAWARHKHKHHPYVSSPFPAQIQFRSIHDCEPLLDSEFRHMFADRQRIRKLDAKQVRGLMKIFCRIPQDRNTKSTQMQSQSNKVGGKGHRVAFSLRACVFIYVRACVFIYVQFSLTVSVPFSFQAARNRR